MSLTRRVTNTFELAMRLRSGEVEDKLSLCWDAANKLEELQAQVERLSKGLRERGHHDIIQDSFHPFPCHDPRFCHLCTEYPEAAR